MAEIEKLDGKSLDVVEQNIEQLKELFPNVFSEGKIQFNKLEELLGHYVVEDEDHYNFTWHGKRKAGRLAQTPSTGTLRPCKEESVDWDTTENLFIEGDNLEVLKLLQKSYHRQVKMIYIDPPYNTGNDFVYEDDFKDGVKNYLEMTGQLDGDGKKVGTNSSAVGRYHTNWLNMMYPRLKLARNLMRDDGAIFISIDDNEVNNLRKLCDDIFGEENFRNTFILKRYDKNINRQFIKDGLSSFNTGFEYVVCYSKSSKFKFNAIYREASAKRQKSGYWKGFWNDADRPTMRYNILGFEPQTGQWKWSQEKATEAIENYKEYEDKYSSSMTLEEYWESTDKTKKFIKRNPTGSGKNQGVEHWIEPSIGILRNTSWLDVFASKTTSEVKGLFDFPKNPEAIKLMMECAVGKDDIILDFFAGSGTTAKAVLEYNLDKGKSNRFVCVQLPELLTNESFVDEHGFENIADISKERIRRVSQGIQEENSGYKGDLGFKVFRLDSSNIKRWEPAFETLEKDLLNAADHIKSDRSTADVLYELLLKYGLDLAAPVKRHEVKDKVVYSIGSGALVLCLDEKIDMDLINGIIALKNDLKPEIMRVVFKDDYFLDGVIKTNALQKLKKMNISDVKSI